MGLPLAPWSSSAEQGHQPWTVTMERNPAAFLGLDLCCWRSSHPAVSTVGYWVWRTSLEEINAPRLLEITPASYTQCLVPQSLDSKLELPLTLRMRFLHTSHIPARKYVAKNPTGYCFYLFKDKLLINTIDIAGIQKQLCRKRQQSTWIAFSKLNP